ncbi:MAG: hypothetical protein ACYTF5_10660, partial [Planctomycetota bacterium]
MLWAAALVPPVLYVSSLSAPVDTVLWAAQAGRYLWYAAIALGATVVLLLLLYPPFLPFVRMGL